MEGERKREHEYSQHRKLRWLHIHSAVANLRFVDADMGYGGGY